MDEKNVMDKISQQDASTILGVLSSVLGCQQEDILTLVEQVCSLNLPEVARAVVQESPCRRIRLESLLQYARNRIAGLLETKVKQKVAALKKEISNPELDEKKRAKYNVMLALMSDLKPYVDLKIKKADDGKYHLVVERDCLKAEAYLLCLGDELADIAGQQGFAPVIYLIRKEE